METAPGVNESRGQRPAETSPHPARKDTAKGSGILFWIAAFKLIKCVMLGVAAVVTLRLARGNMLELLSRWTELLRVDPDNRFAHYVLSRIFATDPRKLDYLAAGTIIYAAVFGIEGIGLLLRKRWAEYFTIVSTSLLIPLEVYELVHHATALKAVVLFMNLAIVAYLIARVRRTAPGALQLRSAPSRSP